jgi:hypothetical protein
MDHEAGLDRVGEQGHYAECSAGEKVKYQFEGEIGAYDSLSFSCTVLLHSSPAVLPVLLALLLDRSLAA